MTVLEGGCHAVVDTCQACGNVGSLGLFASTAPPPTQKKIMLSSLSVSGMDWLWALSGREIPPVAKGLMRGFVCTVRRHYWQNGTSCRAESVPCNSSASRPGSSQRGWKRKRKTCILPGEPERALPVTPVAWVTPSSLSTFKCWTQRKVRFARLSCECHEQATWPYRHGNCGISHWVIKPFQVLWELKGEGGWRGMVRAVWDTLWPLTLPLPSPAHPPHAMV